MNACWHGQEMEPSAPYISSFYEAALVETCQLLAQSTGWTEPCPHAGRMPGCGDGSRVLAPGAWRPNDAIGDFQLSSRGRVRRKGGTATSESCGSERDGLTRVLDTKTTNSEDVPIWRHRHTLPLTLALLFFCLIFSKHNCRLNCFL